MKKKNIFVISLFIIFFVCFFLNKKEEMTNTVENEIAQNEVANDIEIAEYIINNEESVQVVQKEKKSMDGKTIAFIGDSLIEGYGNEFRGFDYYLAQELPNTNFINNSKSGSTITDNSGEENIIMINQAKTLTGNPDIIVFDGGANDVMGYSLGFLNNDLKKEIGNSENINNDETVIADLAEVIVELKNRFPNAKLCYVQPFLLDEETISNLVEEEDKRQEIRLRRDEFFNELPKLCEKLNVEYLDISSQFIGTGITYRQDDWTHIKEEGYKKLVPDLLKKLKEM